MAKIDFISELDWLYKASTKNPSFAEVPEFSFLMIDGKGETGSRQFREALYVIYNVAWTIKMLPKNNYVIKDYFEYLIPPMECVFHGNLPLKNFSRSKSPEWTIMIMQPEFITPDIYHHVADNLKEFKQAESYSRLRFEKFHEGLSVQMVHYGPFAARNVTAGKIEEYIKTRGFEPNGYLHEIFYTDPRKIRQEKYKSLLRLPVIKKTPAVTIQ